MKKNTVTLEQVNEIMEATEFDVKTIFGKVTVVTAKLPNGFTIVESSACVDPTNYDEVLGTEICKQRIEREVWKLEGYLLQEKLFGTKSAIVNSVVNVQVDSDLVIKQIKQFVDEEFKRLKEGFDKRVAY